MKKTTIWFIAIVLMFAFVGLLIIQFSYLEEIIDANLKAGKPFVIRQNNPTTGTTTFNDDLYGSFDIVKDLELDIDSIKKVIDNYFKLNN